MMYTAILSRMSSTKIPNIGLFLSVFDLPIGIEVELEMVSGENEGGMVCCCSVRLSVSEASHECVFQPSNP